MSRSRAWKFAQARRMRRDGLLLKQIAFELEVPVTTVHRWCSGIEREVGHAARANR